MFRVVVHTPVNLHLNMYRLLIMRHMVVGGEGVRGIRWPLRCFGVVCGLLAGAGFR